MDLRSLFVSGHAKMTSQFLFLYMYVYMYVYISGIFLVEMASFMFLSPYRDTRAIFYLFYEITKVFSSFHDVIHVSVP